MPYGFLDIAATPSVRAAQAAMGSDRVYRDFKGGRAYDSFTPNEASFIAQRDSFYIATVSETGWPYVQHRGGPRGFLKTRPDPNASCCCISWHSTGTAHSTSLPGSLRQKLAKLCSRYARAWQLWKLKMPNYEPSSLPRKR